MNLLDKTIQIINPRAALRREQYRVRTQILQDQVRRYEAAALGRRTSGWKATNGSANTETQGSMTLLRARMRDLVRNNSYAASAIEKIVNNTIGSGIRPSIVNRKGKTTRPVEAIRETWKDWADSTACDWDEITNFYGLQALVTRAMSESGEAIILKKRTKNKTVPLQLQVLEGDFLDADKTIRGLDNSGGWITQGVQFSADGKREGYWLFEQHPGEYGVGASRFVPADLVIHAYRVLRPGQVRGVPWGHSAMMKLRDFDDYEDAELMRQKIAACFAVFVHDADPLNPSGTAGNDELERIEPGMIEYLPAGKTVTMATPQASDNYEGYSKTVLRGVSAGFGPTYEAVTGDLSNVNFSSGRMGWIEFQRQVENWQEKTIIPQVCDRVWKWFAEAVELSKGYNTEQLKISWTPPRREMIDPKKETEAVSLQIQNRLTSWSDAVRQLGWDPEQLMAEIIADDELFAQSKTLSLWLKQIAEKKGPEGGNASSAKKDDGVK